MADNRRCIQHRYDENVQPRLAAKLNNQPGEDVKKRQAFSELGNKPTNSQQVEQNNHLKQKGPIDRRPSCLIKKPTTLPLVTNRKNTVDSHTSADTRKKFVVRQESTLNRIYCDAPKDAIKKGISTSTLSRKKSFPDPDEDIKHEPNMAPEYIQDIFNYLRELEKKYAVKSNFLEEHKSTTKMRTMLVNWLVEVHLNFKFNLDTLHLCISIIDRYLQENKKIGRSTLQLVGTSAMLVASKYEEIYIPDLTDFEYICDNAFSKNQILQMEGEILKTLNFSLGKPTSLMFLRRYSKLAQVKGEYHVLAKYILELALLDSELSHINPSIQAAAATCLSIGILNESMDLHSIWGPILTHYSTYSSSDFRPVITEFAILIVKSEKSKFDAVRKKYAASKFLKISLNAKLNGSVIRRLTAGKKF